MNVQEAAKIEDQKNVLIAKRAVLVKFINSITFESTSAEFDASLVAKEDVAKLTEELNLFPRIPLSVFKEMKGIA